MKAFLIILLGSLSVGCFILPLLFWIKNPTYTEMEIFIGYWWSFVLGVIFAVVGILLSEKTK